jgi:ribonuclease P protein component
MLPRPNRLPGHLVPFLLNSKTTFHSSLFGLKVSKSSNSSGSSPRLGFIVSTKIAKKAVDRNKIKRLLRESVRPHLKTLKPNTDLLFLAKHPLKNKTLKQTRPVLLSLLKKSKLITNEKSRS